MHYFYGEDTYHAYQAIIEVAQSQNADLRWLDQYDLVGRSLPDLLSQTKGLFGSHVIVIKDPSSLPTATQATLREIISKRDERDVVLWDRQPVDKRSALFKRLRTVARTFVYPDAATLAQELVAASQGNVDLAAARELVQRVGSDGWRLRNEMEKLMLRHTQVTAEHVTAALPETPEAEIFATLDLLVRGDRQQTMQAIAVLLDQGHSEFYLLSMLAYQFRTMYVVFTAAAATSSSEGLARTTGVHPYAIQKVLRYRSRYSSGRLLDILTKILATDFAIKQGHVTARTGLLMLMLNLLQQPAGVSEKA